MPNGGRLTITADNLTVDKSLAAAHPGIAPGDFVVMTVTDTGVGMSQAIVNRILEPSFPLPETSRGPGQRLSTAFNIVNNHGGAIAVESEPDSGTRCSVYLPAKATEVPADLTAAETLPAD